MARAAATVRVQSLDGVWETLGSDTNRGIVPEGISYSHNTWGSNTANLVLKRDPGVPWPDLTAWTPLDIHVAGVKTWSGRITQTPTTSSPDSRQIAVQASGWQYHLDDDPYQRVYVHTRVSEWQDARGFANADLTQFKAAPTVSASEGVATLAFPQGVLIPSPCYAAIVLDLGANSTADSISVDYTSSNNHASCSLIARTGGAIANITSGVGIDAFTVVNNAGASGTASGAFSTASRYVALILTNGTGASLTPAADIYFRIDAVRVFTSSSYRSGSASVLTADMVVTDAISKGCPLLSTDTTGVTAGSFVIPEYAPDTSRSPREHIAAVNSFENYQAYVDVDQRMVFKSRDTSPVVEIGTWSGATFEEASTNSAEDIYNRVLVEGTGPDGANLQVYRVASEQTGATFFTSSEIPQPSNPSATVDVSGWTTNSLHLTRDTGVFDSSPASLRWDQGAGVAPLINHFLVTDPSLSGGIFRAGRTYRLTFAIQCGAGATAAGVFTFIFGRGPSNGGYTSVSSPALAAGFNQLSIDWTPTTTSTSADFTIGKATSAATGSVYIDSLLVTMAVPTLADRRGFRRTMSLPVSSATTSAASQKLADKFLSNHTTTPLKGNIRVTGSSAVRRTQGGQSVHPSQIGLLTNQVIRLTNRIDTDTGAIGKDGTIVSVTYDHDAESAAMEVDNQNSNFEALLARLAVVVGQLS